MNTNYATSINGTEVRPPRPHIEPIRAPATIGPVSESVALIQVIERAALNPNVDIDKMERLIEMQERVLTRNARAAYSAALASLQPELPVIVERGSIKNAKGEAQSTYALWEDINEAIKPALARHGFALSFRTGRQDGQIIVTGILSHREGHSEETTMHLPIDASGSKNAVQAVGSSTSYGKRYTAGALLNITSRGEDDDGKAGGNPETLTDEQAKTIQSRLDEVGANLRKFCAFMTKLAKINIERIDDIPAKHYQAALDALNEYAGRSSL